MARDYNIGDTRTGEPDNLFPQVVAYMGPGDVWDEVHLGVLADGTNMVLPLHTAPQVLLTGSGTSKIQRTVALHCLSHSNEWNIVGIDLHRVGLSWLKKHDNTTVAVHLDEAVTALRNLSEELVDRYTQMMDHGVQHVSELPVPPKAVMCLVSEASILSGANGDDLTPEQRRLRASAAQMLEQLVRLGKMASIHFILGTQKVDVEALPEPVFQWFDARIAAGRTDAETSERLFSSPASAIVSPIKGRGVARILGAFPNTFQSYSAAHKL